MGVLPFANGIVGLGGRNRPAATDISLPGKQMRAFREYDQGVALPPAKPHEPYENGLRIVSPSIAWPSLHVLRVECSGASIKRSRDDK